MKTQPRCDTVTHPPDSTAQIKSTDNTKCWQERGATGTDLMVGM